MASVQGVLLEAWVKTEELVLELFCKSQSTIVWWELCRPELQPQDQAWELGVLRLSSSTFAVSLSPCTALGF